MTRAAPLTPLDVFEWAVVRQSDLGPGVAACAKALRAETNVIRALVRRWDDPRGHMEIVKIRGQNGHRIEAYYNTSG